MLEDAKLANEEYEKERTRVSGTRFTLGQKTYATSLFWQQLQNSEDPLVEIKEASEGVLEGSDLFCIRPGKAPQFSICVSQEGYKKGDIVAAIALASTWSDLSSFIAVFKVDSGWWYICVRNDIVLADGDMLYLNEMDAKDQFFSMLNVPDWGKKIAPQEWGIEGTREEDLEQLLSKGTQIKLQKINAIRGPKLVLLIVSAIIAGIWLLSTIVDFIFMAIPQKPVVQPVQFKEIQEAPPPPEVKPWEKILNPMEIMANCYYGAQELVKILPPGWKIEGITCTPTSITTSWRREIGRVLWIDKALDVSGIDFSSRSVSSNGGQLMASVQMKNVSEINSPPKTTTTDLINIINDLFQSLEQNISLGTASYTSPQKNVYRSVTFSFSSTHDPLTWSDILMKFPGLEIKTLRYDINTKIWQYEGAIYAL